MVLANPENAAEMTAANVINLANSPTSLKPEYVLLGHPDSTFILAGGGRWAPEDLTGDVFNTVSADKRMGAASWSDRLLASLNPAVVVRAKGRVATSSQTSHRTGTLNAMQSFAIGLLCTWFALYVSLWLGPSRSGSRSAIPPGYFRARD